MPELDFLSKLIIHSWASKVEISYVCQNGCGCKKNDSRDDNLKKMGIQ